jgi:hypothetical protein
MTNNIDKQSFGEAGCLLAKDVVPNVTSPTAANPQYQFCAMQCVTDVTISTAIDAPLMTLQGATYPVTFPAGFVLFTPINGGPASGGATGTLTGTAIFYKAL